MTDIEQIKREVDQYMTEYRHYRDNRDMARSVVNKTIDRLHSQGLLMVWNTDMDSAPKDGTPILVMCEKVCPEVCIPYNTTYPVSVSFEYDAWYVNNTDFYAVEAINPTAWMPLPAAPNGGEDE